MTKNISKAQFGFCLVALLILVATPAEAANIFETITSRAATALSSIKTLVFILAGFGLIAFTFAAIFGKLSWKHFANIAIGLFLVASMGLFIQYFVTKDGENYKLSYGNYLGSAFGDTAGTSGDSFGGAADGSGTGNAAGDGKGSETSDGKVAFDPATGLPLVSGSTGAGGSMLSGLDNSNLVPSNLSGSNTSDSESKKQKEKRGLKGFLSDIKNVANAAQQAKNAVDTGISFAKNVASTYENVKNSVKNNGTSFSGLLTSAADIAAGADRIKQETESAVSNVGARVSDVANSVQDVGKTAAEIQENKEIRMNGGETNKVAEWLSREGAGGSVANAIKNKVDSATGSSLSGIGSAAYDVKGVANMTDYGVGGAVGTAVGVAAGAGALVSAVSGGSRSSSEAAADAAVENYKNTVKEAQEKLANGEISQKEFDKMTQKAKKKMQRSGVLAISDDPLLQKESSTEAAADASTDENSAQSATPTLDNFLNGAATTSSSGTTATTNTAANTTSSSGTTAANTAADTASSSGDAATPNASEVKSVVSSSVSPNKDNSDNEASEQNNSSESSATNKSSLNKSSFWDPEYETASKGLETLSNSIYVVGETEEEKAMVKLAEAYYHRKVLQDHINEKMGKEVTRYVSENGRDGYSYQSRSYSEGEREEIAKLQQQIDELDKIENEAIAALNGNINDTFMENALDAQAAILKAKEAQMKEQIAAFKNGGEIGDALKSYAEKNCDNGEVDYGCARTLEVKLNAGRTYELY